MASPGILVDAIAAALGMPRETVTVHDRNLVAAGLRSKHGRGRGAAAVTPLDAARLLTAILASAQIKDSVQAVARYAETRPHRDTSSDDLFAATGIAELVALPARHSFIDALEAVIVSATTGTLLAAARAVSDERRTTTLMPLIEITALTPGTVGDVRIAGLGNGNTAEVRYAGPTPWDKHSATPSDQDIRAWETALRRERNSSDLEQFRRISARTIIRIGELLKP
jgi:hypothetical protein